MSTEWITAIAGVIGAIIGVARTWRFPAVTGQSLSAEAFRNEATTGPVRTEQPIDSARANRRIDLRRDRPDRDGRCVAWIEIT